jgi:trk system potassium uptake protein TrkA
LKIVIVGAGEVGFHIANHLALENKDVVVIDKNPDALQRISDNTDVQVINGSGSSPVALTEAGIKQAEILLAVTDSDETNLVACLVANIISPATKKLARIRSADFDTFHDTFSEHPPHIDTIINPEIEVVKTIDKFMSVSGAIDFGEFADGQVKLVGIRLDEKTELTGTRLSDLPKNIGGQKLLVASIIRDEKIIIPRGNDKLMIGDVVYFASDQNRLPHILAAFDKQADPVKRALIIGGGRIGLRLARMLDEKSIYTKLIEKDPKRCAQLAERLNKVVVLHGDGSDQDLLNEENIRDMDVVVTLTDDEETNILASLLAKRFGAKKTITRISKFSYLPLMSTIGLDQIVSPRLSSINTILHHVRRGKVLSAISIKGDQAEVLEAVALETSDIVGKPLKKISFPKGALITSIIRNSEVIIPEGESVIEPNDRIIIFARRQDISKIEKILAVKLEFF